MSRSVRQLLARLERLEVLYKISNIVNTTLEPGEVLRLLLEEVVRITRATSGTIAMIDHRKGVLNIETAINIHPRLWKSLKLEIGVGVTGHAAYTGKSVRVDDVERDPHYVRLKAEIRSEMALPMVIKGRVIGVINVDSTRRGAFTQEDEELCMAVAIQSAKVIETARLHDAVKRHAEEMDALFTVGKTLIQPGPLEQILERIVEEGLSMMNGKVCVLLEVMDGGALRPWAISGGMNEYQEKLHSQLGEPLFGQVVKSARPARLDDIRTMSRLKVRDVAEREGFVSAAAVPVSYQGRVLAVLALFSDDQRRFREAEMRLLQLLANQGGLAIENMRRMDRLTMLEESLRLSERFALLGTLAAEIAHEIRNPITIINLLMHSIQETPGHSDQTRSDLMTIMNKLERINQIIEQTLSLSKTGELHLQRASLNKLLEDLVMFLNYKLSKAQIRVVPALDPKVPEIMMDPGQVQQVLLNLIVNAMQAMPQGGELRLKTRLTSDRKLGECVRCIVEDTGVGMTPDVIQRLFDPFYTTREGGTGLGLFISNKLIRRHNGNIRVKSSSGRGSVFTITLPCSREVVAV
jgi:signal transduction histidine kinase